jgi:hypothetical protein
MPLVFVDSAEEHPAKTRASAEIAIRNFRFFLMSKLYHLIDNDSKYR